MSSCHAMKGRGEKKKFIPAGPTNGEKKRGKGGAVFSLGNKINK